MSKEYVKVNEGKVKAQLVAKKRSANDVCIKAGMPKGAFSDSLRKTGRIEKNYFYRFCKELGITAKYYIIEDDKKADVKKQSIKAIKQAETKSIIEDKPLVINLKKYTELSELIEVEKQIRDAIIELTKELKACPVDRRPRAYLADK